jgi:hypothetical protein
MIGRFVMQKVRIPPRTADVNGQAASQNAGKIVLPLVAKDLHVDSVMHHVPDLYNGEGQERGIEELKNKTIDRGKQQIT